MNASNQKNIKGMTLREIIEFIGGATVIIGALAWTVRLMVSSLIKNKLDKNMLEFTNALNKIERLETFLTQERGKRYRLIWSLTGSLNIFGPDSDPDCKELSRKLKDWYFSDGMILSEPSKMKYFLVQEIVNFGILHGLKFSRPSDEILFGSKKRPMEVLSDIRGEFRIHNNKSETAKELTELVNKWKMEDMSKKTPIRNWVLLQFIMSKFRSGLIEDLDLRSKQKTIEK